MAVGRNELCPCGSGKKYKHCCALKKDRASIGSWIVATLIALVLLTGGVYLLISLNAA
jgi:SEC-C motif-containing protein